MSAPPRTTSPTLSSIFAALLVGAGVRGLRRLLGPGEERRPPRSGFAADLPPPAAPGWWSILRRTFSEVNSDRVQAVAGGVTFYGLLSLFPAVTVLVSFYGLFADPASISPQLQALGSVLPGGALGIVSEQISRITATDQSKLGLAAILGLVVAGWSANAATKAMMDALNIAYEVEEKRSFIVLNLVSLGFTLAAIIGLIVMITVIAAVPVILKMFYLGATGDVLLWAGRWPATLVLIWLAVAVVYRWGPSRPGVAWRWITPGSVLASIALVAFSMLFSWYAASIGHFDATYGSLGAVIGFLLWMWLSITIVLVGAELDAEIEAAGRRDGQGPPSTEDQPR